jgi:hypothetical protein
MLTTDDRYQAMAIAHMTHCRYCEIINNHGVLIFADFLVHFNHENKIFPLIGKMQCLKPQIQEPMDRCILQKSRKLVPTNKSTLRVNERTVTTFHILIFSSKSTWSIGTKRCRNDAWKVIYKWSYRLNNMATRDNSSFWLVKYK